jgi:predicted deacylase
VEKAERPEKPEKSEKAEKPEKPEKPEKSEKAEKKDEKPEKRDWTNKPIAIGGVETNPGETRSFALKVAEYPDTTPMKIPIIVVNGIGPGPTLLVNAAVHGDELNGVEIVRELIFEVDHGAMRGALVCVPVVNVPGFLNSTRYLPDRRDLNRSFPGDPKGNMADRIAWEFFEHVVRKCDYVIDLHTAAEGRDNMPHTRADMEKPEVRRIARAFGSRVVINNEGNRTTLRYNAIKQGIPAITVEMGEAHHFQFDYIKEGLSGVLNVMVELNMIDGTVLPPPFRTIVRETEWLRAGRGGILLMKTKPETLAYEGDLLAQVTSPFGTAVDRIVAPFTGIIVGVTTEPLAEPGAPICHIVKVEKTLETVKRELSLAQEYEIRSSFGPGGAGAFETQPITDDEGRSDPHRDDESAQRGRPQEEEGE